MGWFSDNVLGLDPSGGGINTLIKDPIGTAKNILSDPLKYAVQGFESLNLIGAASNQVWKFEHPRVPNIPIIDLAANILINKDGNIVKVPVIYGTRRVGGIIVFAQVSGKDLYLVVVFCEGEISAINTIYIDDVASTDARFTTSSPALVHITKYVGTTSQTADSSLIGLSSPTLWTSAYQGKGLAYAVIRLTYDADAFNGLPKIAADIDGKKVYDPRDTTTKFSSNPALCIRDYLTNSLYGKGLSTSLIDDTLIESVANDCDITMSETTASPTSSIAQFECNVVLNTENTVMDNLKILLASCHGYLSYYGGTYNLRIEQDESSVYDFTTDNMVGTIGVANGGKDSRLNRLKVIYTNPDQNYADGTYVYESTTLRTNDNGAILESEITLAAETNSYRAQWHAEYVVKRSRQQITCQLTATPEALRCVPGDIVTVTYSSLGWTSKKFRVTALSLRLDCLVDVSLIEHESTIYDRTIPATASTPSNTSLPDPFTVSAPTGLTLQSGADYVLITGDQSIQSRIYVTWTIPTEMFIHHFEVQYKITSSSDWHGMNPIPSDQSSVFLGPLQDGVDYTVRVRTVNSLGVRSAWSSTTHTVASINYHTNLSFFQTAMPSAAAWYGIAWNGTVLCAIGYNSSSAATSTDGIIWNARTLPSSTTWYAIAWNGTVFCAIANASTAAATSPDGTTWTARTLPSAAQWSSLAWNGSVFCAVSGLAGGSTAAATSPDGITWTARTLPSLQNWVDIAWNGTVFCAIGYGSNVAATSPDGITWTSRTLPANQSWRSIAWNGSVFCAVATNYSTAATSPDGITWTSRTLPFAYAWVDIAWNGTVFCVVSPTYATAITSADGITWKQRPLPTYNTNWRSIGSDGTIFCVAGDLTTIAAVSLR